MTTDNPCETKLHSHRAFQIFYWYYFTNGTLVDPFLNLFHLMKEERLAADQKRKSKQSIRGGGSQEKEEREGRG